jgi:hypothetical protein
MIRTPGTKLETPDPGTSDLAVCADRLRGRVAYRDAPEVQPVGQETVQWWLGWYDEVLRKWYGR